MSAPVYNAATDTLIHAVDASSPYYSDPTTMGAANFNGVTRLTPQPSPMYDGGAVNSHFSLIASTLAGGKAVRISYPLSGTQNDGGVVLYSPGVVAVDRVLYLRVKARFNGPVTHTQAIKWMRWLLNNNSGGGAPSYLTHDNSPTDIAHLDASKHTFWQVYNGAVADNLAAYPDGSDQGAQPVGPYFQDLFDGAWHTFVFAYRCHQPEPGITVSYVMTGSQQATATFSAPVALTNGQVLALERYQAVTVSAFDGNRTCTLTRTGPGNFIPETPTGLTATPSASGGTLAAGTYYIKAGAVNSAALNGGESTASTEVSAVTTGATGSIALACTAVPGATGYRFYIGTSAGGENVYFDSATPSFTYTGAAGTAGTPLTSPAWPKSGLAFARTFDGLMRMWIDDTKVLDVSLSAAGQTPPGGTKQWCNLHMVQNIDVNDPLKSTNAFELGNTQSNGYQYDSWSVDYNMGDGTTTSPDTMVMWTGAYSAPTATQLLLSQQPAGAVSGVALTTQPSGTVADSGGSTVTSDTSTVTASWVSLTGDATASGTLTTDAVAGDWAFTDLALTWTVPSQGYWHFTDGSLTAVNSNTLTLTVAALPASKLLLTTQPSGAADGVALTQQPVVTVADTTGTTVTTDSSTVMAAVLTGAGVTITGGATKAASAGVASFTGLTLSATSTTTGVVLRFSDGALTVVDSAPFTVTASDAPPDYGITPGAPAVYRMARGKALFAGFRRMVRAVWRWLTLSASLA